MKLSRIALFLLGGILVNGLAAEPMDAEFQSPSRQYRPETWFHLIGNNISREGLTRDLEAIQQAGIRGIQLFNKSGGAYPGVPQVRILSPEWREMMRHAADECQRLGLDFTLQNCPGWSQTGGPWVPVEEAQRELVQSVTRIEGGKPFAGAVPVDRKYEGDDFDYQDVCVLAFPSPSDDASEALIPDHIESNNPDVAWETIFDPAKAVRFAPRQAVQSKSKHAELRIGKVGGEDSHVQVRFNEPVTVRAIELPPVRVMNDTRGWPAVDYTILVESVEGGQRSKVALLTVPNTCWMDRQYSLTLALPETTTRELRLTFRGGHPQFVNYCFLQGRAQIDNWQAKAGFVLRDLMHGATPQYPSSCFVPADVVIDLTAKMNASGRIDWTPPKGDWTVVRFGHVNMRQTNGPSVPEATGWECSKLDKIALENHLRKGMIGSLLGPGAPCGDGKLGGLLIDSWERYIQTWTMESETLFTEFKNRRGYALRPYLPAMMGYIVNSPEHTEKFLRDLRATMDELYFENFFTEFQRIAHDMDAIVYSEGAAGEVLPGDALRYYSVSDVPMTEFWFSAAGGQGIDSKPPSFASSAAHLYGKKIVAAEALTQGGLNWKEHPFAAKALIDEHFTHGINHLVFHTFSHTPQLDVAPGSSFGDTTGFPFVRNQTWWRNMPAFTEYLARCQYVLQQGVHVADVLWYLGDELERPPLPSTPFPAGHRYDLLNPDVLQTRLSVRDGKIHVMDGGDYRLIQLRNSSRMLRSTAERLRELVMAGAVVLGDKPLDSPSLTDGPEALNALHAIAGELWGDGPSGVKRTGKGRVYWGMPLEDVLRAEAIAPDLISPAGSKILWIHRQTDDAEIYFLSNQSRNAVSASIDFRIAGKAPELWDAITGERRMLGVWRQEDGRARVALRFDPAGSAIVVFRKEAASPSWVKALRDGETVLDSGAGWFREHADDDARDCVIEQGALTAWRPGRYTLTDGEGATKTIDSDARLLMLDGPWSLAFAPGWDAPATLELPRLISLTDHADLAVRYYSGTVDYRKEFQLAAAGGAIQLDLGDVANIAEVWCNGTRVGTRWAPPFVFDLSQSVRPGANELIVKVTNAWRNQLIYDETRPRDQRKTWTSNPPRNSGEKPEPAGLIGPVVIRTAAVKDLR